MSTPTFTKPHIRLPGGRPFHLLLTSLAVSSCGDWLYNVALLAFVYERTRSATWLAVTTGRGWSRSSFWDRSVESSPTAGIAVG